MRCAVFSQKEGQGVGGEGTWHPRIEMMGSECGEVRVWTGRPCVIDKEGGAT